MTLADLQPRDMFLDKDSLWVVTGPLEGVSIEVQRIAKRKDGRLTLAPGTGPVCYYAAKEISFGGPIPEVTP